MNQFFNSHMQNQQQGFGPNFDWNSALQSFDGTCRWYERLICNVESLVEVPQGSLLMQAGK